MPTMKGAFLNMGAGLLGPLPNIVVFQFNPERVTRNPLLIQLPRPNAGAGRKNALPQPDGPVETMSFLLRVDANDQLANNSPTAMTRGILPTLSAIELLMVPRKFLQIDL